MFKSTPHSDMLDIPSKNYRYIWKQWTLFENDFRWVQRNPWKRREGMGGGVIRTDISIEMFWNKLESQWNAKKARFWRAVLRSVCAACPSSVLSGMFTQSFPKKYVEWNVFLFVLLNTTTTTISGMCHFSNQNDFWNTNNVLTIVFKRNLWIKFIPHTNFEVFEFGMHF